MTQSRQQSHPFQKAGLGRPPYYVIGVTAKVYVACPGAPEQPAGTCDYCGNGIKYVYAIRSADGQTFGVGSECVRKADPDLYEAFRERQRDERAAVQGLEEMELHALLADEAVRTELAQHPHPQSWRAAKGETLLDSCEWFQANAGHSGKLQTLAAIKRITGASLAPEEVAAYAPIHEAKVAAERKARQDEMKRLERNRKARIRNNRKRFAWIIAELTEAHQDRHGEVRTSRRELREGFIGSMLNQWEDLESNPWGAFTSNMLWSCCDVIAKRHGRRNSKAYEAAQERFWALVGDEPDDN